MMWGNNTDKLGMGRRGLNKLTEATSGRPRLAAIIDGGSGDKSPKSGGREIFVRGGKRNG